MQIASLARKSFPLLLLGLLPLAGDGLPAGEPGGPAAGKLRILVVTGGHDFDPLFFDLFKLPGIEMTKADQQAAGKSFLAGDVKGFDAIVLYDMWQKIAEDEKKKLTDLLEKGQGLVVLHHALATYGDWPEFGKIVGGKFFTKPSRWEGAERGTSGYQHDVKFKVRVEDSRHPVTRGLKDFEIVDETYNKYWVDPKAHVLLTTDEPTSDRALAWTRTAGRSRVVYIQLGHGGPAGAENAFTSPSYRKLLEQAIRWAAAPEGTVKLFNGRDLAGFEARGNASWTVEEGILVGKQGPGNAPGDLFTRDEYGDFELKVVYQVVWPANSGIWFRYVSDDATYQADILEWKNPVCLSGTIYCPGKMFLATNTDPATVNREGWNEMAIRAQGDLLQVSMNGKKVCEARDVQFPWGKIGIQVHPGDEFAPMRIRIKEMTLTTLSK